MHVLGLPPAFVLSQDQTLKLKSNCLLILDVRTSAHMCPSRLVGTYSVCCASGFHKKTRNRPNSEADTGHRVAPTSAIYVQLFVHRMNQTAHISLQILSISKSVRDKIDWMRPLLFGAPCLIYPSIFRPPRCRLARLTSRWCISAPPVRWYLRFDAETRNPFFWQTSSFFQKTGFPRKNGGLGPYYFTWAPFAAIFLRHEYPLPPRYGVIHRLLP